MVEQLVNNKLSRMQKQPRPNLRFSAIAGLREMSTYIQTKNLYSTQKDHWYKTYTRFRDADNETVASTCVCLGKT